MSSADQDRPSGTGSSELLTTATKIDVGSLLARRYAIERPLGEGGMGQVFEARDTVLGRKVAVKLISPDYREVDPQAVTRMFREARAAAKIRHHNVVEVLDFVADEPAFLLMELLEGQSLRELLKEHRKARQLIPWQRVCAFVVQVVAALDAAHRAGVIHRDMKPSNCFLVDDPLRPDRIKVVDFGVARMELSAHPVELESSEPKPVVGTSAYLAPERWLGEPADARSDLYAVGIMTYELLLGLRPFRGANIESQHAGQEPQSPRSRMPAAGIPGWLNAFVMRLLSKNPADRFASAQAALVHLLDKTQGAGFDFDPAAGSLTAPVASRSRLGWIAAGVLAGALAVVALVAIAARLPNTSQPRGVQGEQARE